MSLRFLVDACLPRDLSSPAHGFDSIYALDALGDGATDAAIAAMAIAQDRVIVTADIKDFSILAAALNLPPVVLVDLGARWKDTVAAALNGMAEAVRREAGLDLQPGTVIRVRRNGRITLRVQRRRE